MIVRKSFLITVLLLAVGLTAASLLLGRWECTSYFAQAGLNRQVCDDAGLAQLQAAATTAGLKPSLSANIVRGLPFAYLTQGGLQIVPLLTDFLSWFAALVVGWLLWQIVRALVGNALDYNFER